MHEVFNIGCDSTHGGDFTIDRENGFGRGCFLLLFVKTEALFFLNGTTQKTEPATLILYDRAAPQKYSACGDIYIDDWMQFSAEDDIIQSLSIPMNVPIHIGNAIMIDQYFRLILEAFKSSRHNKDYTCSFLLHALLYAVSDYVNETLPCHRYYSNILHIRHEIFEHPDVQWSVDRISEELHLSRSYFHEIYKKTFGSSCIADIISSRISRASDLLSSSDIPIKEIAEKCGYNSFVHFSRQFKEQTGLTPSEFRKQKFNK